MTPQFFFFDLGNVLLGFDHRRAARNLAVCTLMDPEVVWNALFETGNQLAYERGLLTTEQVHERVSRQLLRTIRLDDFSLAISDMFWLNGAVVPILAQLRAAGHRLGVLSNTCAAHWEFIRRKRYRVLEDYFEHYVLSFEVGSMKPEPAIYQAAQRLTGLPPERHFFVDDRAENVTGAQQVGWDARQYISPSRLVRDLIDRRVGFNL